MSKMEKSFNIANLLRSKTKIGEQAPTSENKPAILDRISILINFNKLLWVIILIGIILRLIQYLYNRSLWLDESYLALNIVNKSFFELWKPLDYDQGAPIGFLMAEKVFYNIFGGNEYSLRFLPFLSGIISLFIFYKIVKRFKPKTALISSCLFAISPSLIYYSYQVKQYSSDVTVALLLWWIISEIKYKECGVGFIILLGFIGGISIWFSHPSIFILAGGAFTFTYIAIKKEKSWLISRFTFVYLIWGISFICFYFVSLRMLSNNNVLIDCWKYSFAPFPLRHISDIVWYYRTLFDIFEYPVGINFTGIAALAFIVGCNSLFIENRDKFYLLISSIIFTLLASCLHKYPFSGRFLLFILPFLLIFIAEGSAQLIEITKNGYKIIGVIFICLLFFHPLLSTTAEIIKPHNGIRSVLDYVESNQKDGDIIYIYYYSYFPYEYYSDHYTIKNSYCIQGVMPTSDWSNLLSDLDKLRGNKRVWFLFSSPQEDIGFNAEKISLYYLNKIGKKLKEFKTTGDSGYLYDLSQE